MEISAAKRPLEVRFVQPPLITSQFLPDSSDTGLEALGKMDVFSYCKSECPKGKLFAITEILIHGTNNNNNNGIWKLRGMYHINGKKK